MYSFFSGPKTHMYIHKCTYSVLYMYMYSTCTCGVYLKYSQVLTCRVGHQKFVSKSLFQVHFKEFVSNYMYMYKSYVMLFVRPTNCSVYT